MLDAGLVIDDIARAVVGDLDDLLGHQLHRQLACAHVLATEILETVEPAQHGPRAWHLLIAAERAQALAIQQPCADRLAQFGRVVRGATGRPLDNVLRHASSPDRRPRSDSILSWSVMASLQMRGSVSV